MDSNIKPDSQSFAESEENGWCSDYNRLNDPKPLKPRMKVLGGERGWWFHARAEQLNGRLAIVGFMLGVLIEWLTGYGMAQQLGLGLLRRYL